MSLRPELERLSSRSPGHLFLTGYRGSGKTSVAGILAERLGRPWVDTDDVVEADSGIEIAAIFAQHGETGFRERETIALQKTIQQPRQIIALGGGAILRETNRDLIRRAGRVVWLNANPNTIAARLAADSITATRRPSLTGGNVIDEIAEVMKQRDPIYRSVSDVRIEVDAMSPAEIAAKIIRSEVFDFRSPNSPPNESSSAPSTDH